MPDTRIHRSPRTIDNIALAYFSREEKMHDAARDLYSAGFAAAQINISNSFAGAAVAAPLLGDHALPNAIGAHTLRWQVNRARAHDRQRRGADQISGFNPMPSEGFNPTCSTLDLSQALGALSISSDVISLLHLDMKHRGMFLLVDAPDRVDEASVILSTNAGYLRTQYLTAAAA